jgi:hypothetical protein
LAAERNHLRSLGRVSRLLKELASHLAKNTGQPVTVNVADAALLLWRPLARKVSRRPGIFEPAKPLGTVNEAATSPLLVALVVVSTAAPKVMSTCSEGANPRQVRVTLDPAGPSFGEMAQVALAGVATVAVVVPVDAAVGRVVVTEEGVEGAGAAVWSAVRDAQPVAARVGVAATANRSRPGRDPRS